MQVLQNLSESALYPSRKAVSRSTARQIADLFHMHICALMILRSSPHSEKFAKDYARKTIANGGFRDWRQSSTDLAILGWALLDEEVELRLPKISDKLREKLTIDTTLLTAWLRTVSGPTMNRAQTMRLFTRLDMWLRIDDESLKAIRRLVMDWDGLSAEEAALSMTRLLQLLRAHGSRADLLVQLEKLAQHHGLELKNVCNPETGDGCSVSDHPKAKKKDNLFAKIGAVAAGAIVGYNVTKGRKVKEDASAGATCAGDIAAVAIPFGAVQRRVMPTTIATKDSETTKTKRRKKRAK